MALTNNRKSRYPTWRHCWSCRNHLLRLAIFFPLSFVFLACAPNSPSQNAYAGHFVGSYEEIIELPGPVAPGFSDADFVQLLRPDDIPPIYSPVFVPASDANLPSDELVIGLAIGNHARAYPTGILFSREIVNDVVDGVPVLVTWCPRCYASLVHDRRIDGEPLVFGNQGALYRGAMTWYDHQSGSVWSQPLGASLAGPKAGASLRLIPSQLTTWSNWLESRPETTVLVVDTPSQPFRGHRPGPDHVVGVVIGGAAAAIPYDEILPGHSANVAVGDAQIKIWRDATSETVRAVVLDNSANRQAEVPVLIAYRSAWLKFYPGSVTNPPRELAR